MVEGNKKVSMFLTFMGGEAYEVLKDLLVPELPRMKTYQQLKDILVLHYSLKRLIIAERYNFYLSKQEPNEPLRDYAQKLKHLSKYCQFGNFLNEALRDKFVCGLKSDAIRRKLLTESNLTFERALQEAQSMEAVEDQSRFLESDTVLSKLGATNSKNLPKKSAI
ncbi:uncharacterized protein [Diabrotica undecimpunctata]|uniref:uncharacterized protein n=1 Tax=Diabrotica undecimpunctata TaxID=50387 RepID=UPI003B6324D1